MNRIPNPCYVVAVSGGVDSVVLLDMLHRQKAIKIVVAHVDHGIRPESGQDAEFVKQLAAQYQVEFVSTSLQLGSEASELVARNARYKFLRDVAKQYDGVITTAHHADDLVETVAINLKRGTGWRGLAVFGAADIYRPLTKYFKDELIAYAKRHKLDWREDKTNQDDRYTRNKIRPFVAAMDKATRLEIVALWRHQQVVAAEIDTLAEEMITAARHFYIMAPPVVAREVMRASLVAYRGIICTRPQLDGLVLACKTARPGTKMSLGKDWMMVFSKEEFSVVHR